MWDIQYWVKLIIYEKPDMKAMNHLKIMSFAVPMWFAMSHGKKNYFVNNFSHPKIKINLNGALKIYMRLVHTCSFCR